MPLKVDVLKKEEGVFVVSPAGSIDSETYIQLEQKVNPVLISVTKALVLDMAGVEYISSMGISTLLKIRKGIEARAASFIMINLQPQIKLAFEIIKALPDMRIFENMEEADEYLLAMERKDIEERSYKSKG